MKTFLLILLFAIFLNDTSNAQNTFPLAGNVGIGTSTPTTSLYIQNSNTTYASTLTLKNTANNIAARAGLTLENDMGNQTYLYKQASGSPDANDVILYSVQGHTRIYTNGLERLRITHSGNIGINTIDPTEKLSVKGKIRAQEVKVESANWPDYVFTDAYQIPSLKETEDYINKNGHLPGIPSAAEVKANGIELGVMNAKLLQKIEEITLFLIDQTKQIELLKIENIALKDKMLKNANNEIRK